MTESPIADLETHFGQLDDKRIERRQLHNLIDVMVIAICTMICGADNWVEVQYFGERKQAWLKLFLSLPNGIPLA